MSEDKVPSMSEVDMLAEKFHDGSEEESVWALRQMNYYVHILQKEMEELFGVIKPIADEFSELNRIQRTFKEVAKEAISLSEKKEHALLNECKSKLHALIDEEYLQKKNVAKKILEFL